MADLAPADDDVLAREAEILAKHRADPLVTPIEMAQTGNLSRQTIWRKVKEGKFPRPAKVDGRSLWSQREIDQWVADRLAERFEAQTERPGGAK